MILTLYGIPRKRAEPRQFFLAAIEKQLSVGVRNVRAKKLSCQPSLDEETLRLFIQQKLSPK